MRPEALRIARTRILFSIAIAALTLAPHALAQRPTDKARVELASDRTAHARGSAARIAAVVDVDAGWHIQSHQPTFHYPRFWEESQIRWVRLRVSTAGLRKIDKLGVEAVLAEIAAKKKAAQGADHA